MDTGRPVEIADNIYWVGINIQESGLHCNPYLIISGEEAVLIDPGSPLDFSYVYDNVTSLVPLSAVKYIILQHQDPDLCASTPLFEKAGAVVTVCTHWRTAQLVKYYGIQSPFRQINPQNSSLTFGNGRTLHFFPTPYLHFPGAITTYDPVTQTLFSSDLFGSFSHQWRLFADELMSVGGRDHYMEAMKTFHEHYMPSNEVLRPIMEQFLQMDIRTIAPQHGSIIRRNVSAYIQELKHLECGGFLNPIKKEVAKMVGLDIIVNQVMHRLFATFPTDEVMEIFANTGIVVDPTTEDITDYPGTSQELWQTIFRLISAHKGWSWLTAIEPLTVKLVREYGIDMPDVFDSTLLVLQKESHVISEENRALKEVNERLEHGLSQANDALVKCPITGLYNESMLMQYLPTEIEAVQSAGANSALLVMSIDDMAYLNTKYGRHGGNEILRSTAYTLSGLIKSTHSMFKIGGSAFVYYMANTDRKTAKKTAESVRTAIAASTLTVEPVTVSIGISFVDELPSDTRDKVNHLLHTGQTRMMTARRNGQNQVWAEEVAGEELIRRGKLLVADYDKLNAEIMKSALEQEQYEVILAADGDEAHKLICAEVPDMVITELMLPKLDALLLKEKLRQTSTTQNIPFVIISYHKDAVSVRRATALGIVHYLQKPYFIDEVLGIIHNKLGQMQKSS